MSICNVAHLTHQFDEKILYQDAERRVCPLFL